MTDCKGNGMFHRHGGDIYSCRTGQDAGSMGDGQETEYIYQYNRIQDFSSNINFRGMPECVQSAAEKAVEWSEHYPDTECRTLRAALAKRENRAAAGALPVDESGGWIRPEQIICGNGAAELMFALAAAYRPRKALLAVPSFFEYEQALTVFGCRVRHFFLREEQDFRLEESFLEELEKEVDCVILGNPNNPTGQLIDGELLERLVRRCGEQRILLVLDESFYDFLSAKDRSRTFTGVQKLPELSNLFVLRSFTKIYGMPGLRFGYGLCNDQALLEKMRAVLQPWNVSLPAQAAAERAAAEMEYAEETALLNDRNRRQMMRGMENAGYRVYPSNANFLLFRGPAGLKEFCLERGFLIRDCSNFPGLGEGFYRICIRSESENMALMEVLEKAIRQDSGARHF